MLIRAYPLVKYRPQIPGMSVEWSDATDKEGVPTREFRITREGKRDITGALVAA